ncbi:hypothetical protein CFVI02298_10175 [Campylobacter fetus subsp. venerealis cfvi02/298]|nr:hypothetical protein AWR31_10030 [Campylobacter fetus subsp. venerealis]OCS38028.1 hypothetical protein CFVI02298_10175 [Campylobacter fetus subsp. venerealis cfvi02/298]
MILTLLALTLLTLFMQGCTSKEIVISKPLEMQKISFIPVIAQLPIMDFNRTATTEQEAAIMVWDLYSYIKELELSLQSVKEVR